MPTPERSDQQEPQPGGLPYKDVRASNGDLLFRVRQDGIIQVKRKHGKPELVDIWEHLLPKSR
ncbi:MAG: hypothetical protein H0U60_20215 [Blastocatellia bacterium]|nr:hypothetical protein [Blastocatellia bacterium]